MLRLSLVFEPKNKGCDVQVVLNNLYKFTALQMRFPVNAVALVDGTPLTLSLKQFLQKFLEFRCDIVRRRARSAAVPHSHVASCCLCWGRHAVSLLCGPRDNVQWTDLTLQHGPAA